jgi:hypothetical protein
MIRIDKVSRERPMLESLWLYKKRERSGIQRHLHSLFCNVILTTASVLCQQEDHHQIKPLYLAQ